jgi:hypothetical protein
VRTHGGQAVLFETGRARQDAAARVVAVGDAPHTDRPDGPARLWNEMVLREAGDLIDYLSFHICSRPRKAGRNRMTRTNCTTPCALRHWMWRPSSAATGTRGDRQVYRFPAASVTVIELK